MNRYIFTLLCLFFINDGILAQSQDVRLFIFGHSLIDHRPPAVPTPSNETTVPHWIYLLAQGNHTLVAGGQYGFLPQHRRTPPIAQWGYDIVPGVWESDTEPFSDADVNTVMITAGNFIQYQGPEEEYVTDPGITPLSATIDIVDWVAEQEDNVKYYIYENWPDMAGYLSSGFPPNNTEWSNYNNDLNQDFHQWWIDYHDALLRDRPELNIRMIPVGQMISATLISHLTNSITVTELYEDDAPHGRASIYFLAGLATYMAIYQQPAPLDFVIPDIVHSDIRQNYASIVSFMWTMLNAFNTPDGTSRVFFESTTSSEDLVDDHTSFQVFPNPTTGLITMQSIHGTEIRIINMLGQIIKTTNQVSDKSITIDLSSHPKGSYILQFINEDTGRIQNKKVIKY